MLTKCQLVISTMIISVFANFIIFKNCEWGIFTLWGQEAVNTLTLHRVVLTCGGDKSCKAQGLTNHMCTISVGSIGMDGLKDLSYSHILQVFQSKVLFLVETGEACPPCASLLSLLSFCFFPVHFLLPQAKVDNEILNYKDLAALPKVKSIYEVQRPDLISYEPHSRYTSDEMLERCGYGEVWHLAPLSGAAGGEEGPWGHRSPPSQTLCSPQC